jgi:hypothetical protein
MDRREFIKVFSTTGTLLAFRGYEIPDDYSEGYNMETISEEPREIPVAGEFDICVIGGSCTGVFAAVSAARLGAKVAVIENNGFFGGVATAGLVNIWHSVYDTTGQKQIIAGLTTEVVQRLKKRNGVTIRKPSESSHFVLNTEELKIELDELVMEAGVRPFLHTHFAAPVMKDGRLLAVAVEDKSGRRAIKASYFIDATGDGDLIVRMGFPFYKSDHLQPPTTCAIVRGLGKIQSSHEGFSLGREVFDPKYPNALKKGFLWSAKVPGSQDDTMVAGTRIFGADCSVADELTMAEIEGRRQVRVICDILRDNFMDDGSVPLVGLPAKIGIRETRHAECLHKLTETELLTGKRFFDAIANGTYRVDIHHADKPGLTFRYLDGTEVYVVPGEPNKVSRWRDESSEGATFYQIPYGSIVPLGSENMLVAGRVIDADMGAFGAIRVMVNCNQTGEAAGTAAYLALDGDDSVAKVNTAKLREMMKKQGSIII